MSAAEILPDNAPESASPPNQTPTPLGFLISIALIALLAELAYGIVNNSTLPIYINYALGLESIAGSLFASFLAAEALLNGVTGIMADRLGRRTMMVAGPMISIATCILTALLRVPHHGPGRTLAIVALFMLRFLDGAGAAALWPAVFASIGDRVAPERQSSAMGALNVSYMMGIAIGPLTGGFLNDHYATKLMLSKHDPLRYVPSFAIAAAAFLVTALIGLAVAPSRQEQKQKQHTPEPTTATGHETSPVTLKSLMGTLQQIPMLVLLVFVLFFGIGLIAPNFKLYALERLGVSEGQFGLLLLYPAIPLGLLAIPLGRLGDLWGRVTAIRIGSGIAAVSLWLIFLFQSELALEVIGFLLGVGFVLAFPAYLAFLSEIGGDQARGSVIGAVKTFQGVGMLLGAVIGSPLYIHVSPLAPFFGAGIMLTAGFLIALFGVKTPPKPQAVAEV